MSKRYYWLKLKEDFFDSKRIKKLRRMAGGDTFTIIYLKLQLKAMKNEGVLEFDGLENTIAEELALDIDEDPSNVQLTLTYLVSCGLAEASNNNAIFLPFSIENTGSESSSAQRVRKFRAKSKALESIESPEDEPETLQNITPMLQCNISVTESKREEIEIEKDIEIDIDNTPQSGTPAPQELTAYGPHKNVFITSEEYERLSASWPERFDYALERFSNYMFKTKKPYDSHYLTLCSWLVQDAMKGWGK